MPGNGLTTGSTVELAVQPFASVTVTVYVTSSATVAALVTVTVYGSVVSKALFALFGLHA